MPLIGASARTALRKETNMEIRPFGPGEVLLLEYPIPGIPYASGIYVLLAQTELKATLSLVSNDDNGLYAIDNPYEILREDLAAFSPMGKQARLCKER